MKFTIPVAFLVTLLAAPLNATTYQITHPSFGGGNVAHCMNNHGQFAGVTADSHAFFWDPTTGFQDIGTLSGGVNSWVSGINDAGTVIGVSDTTSGDCSPRYPFIWDLTHGIQNMGLANLSSAYAINNSGQVTGETTGAVYIWQNGTYAILPALGQGFVDAYDINNHSQVAGMSYIGVGKPAVCMWDTAGNPHNLNDFGYGYGINDAGTVVGWSGLNYPNSHAYVWYSDGRSVDLGALTGCAKSQAIAINNHGVVILTANLPGGGIPEAYVWSPTDGLKDLGRYELYDINDSGQILGCSGQNILWTPVPEPSSLLMLSGGVFVFLSVLKRRKI